MQGEFIIIDWTGRRLFPSLTFRTQEDGWEFVRGRFAESDWEEIEVIALERSSN